MKNAVSARWLCRLILGSLAALTIVVPSIAQGASARPHTAHASPEYLSTPSYQGIPLAAPGHALIERKAGLTRFHPAPEFALTPLAKNSPVHGTLWVSYRGRRLGTLGYSLEGQRYRYYSTERRRNLFKL